MYSIKFFLYDLFSGFHMYVVFHGFSGQKQVENGLFSPNNKNQVSR